MAQLLRHGNAVVGRPISALALAGARCSGSPRAPGLSCRDDHFRTDRVAVTHQAIADDLGSSREVVGRLLKEFERSGRVRVGRSEIFLRRA